MVFNNKILSNIMWFITCVCWDLHHSGGKVKYLGA